ncbi:protein-L-isoaspartate O-methyltransferase family protein [Cellulosimicrobium sp. SH8]|uniref:protein-L-isoaspartate O-methyltransferase family protein n=1 Tax=Cellulosimicrobium sp. SH8 TaxID=2952936 RepID=UPI0021F363E9|nr:protein-L-isoaspartate O-methyltransferase [Cellulosimicrobium sp. SH8]
MRSASPPGGTSGHARDAVAAAMRVVDRRAFVPRAQRRWAGQDRPLAIGHGQTNSQPSTVAAMLRLLDVAPGDGVLDVGSGSGWTTALLAVLVGPAGHVLGVERDPDLAAWGAANLATAHSPWARIVTAPRGVLGTPGERYDRILVSAAADTLPEALVGQLAPGGRMVIPIRHTMVLVEAAPSVPGEPDEPGRVRLSEHGSYSFVPLVEDPPGPTGSPG